MLNEKLTTTELLNADKLPMLEAKIAFIAMASAAFGMIAENDWDGLPAFEAKAWEGLAWITEEITDQLREWQKQM